jgi:hypothetical protein
LLFIWNASVIGLPVCSFAKQQETSFPYLEDAGYLSPGTQAALSGDHNRSCLKEVGTRRCEMWPRQRCHLSEQKGWNCHSPFQPPFLLSPSGPLLGWIQQGAVGKETQEM